MESSGNLDELHLILPKQIVLIRKPPTRTIAENPAPQSNIQEKDGGNLCLTQR